ncbi:hypothetical protein ARMGADRAFT_1032365 [Armillaria gallica]|uniref:Uncharacterized protein n=1 Tax=Armillaria gallica TaxID=47427 RepID=A0A2H3DAP6_ARMGA|nr:hypothetical protein ARMGADRAFT_1032365 [Armillaria gallica]
MLLGAGNPVRRIPSSQSEILRVIPPYVVQVTASNFGVMRVYNRECAPITGANGSFIQGSCSREGKAMYVSGPSVTGGRVIGCRNPLSVGGGWMETSQDGGRKEGQDWEG